LQPALEFGRFTLEQRCSWFVVEWSVAPAGVPNSENFDRIDRDGPVYVISRPGHQEATKPWYSVVLQVGKDRWKALHLLERGLEFSEKKMRVRGPIFYPP
jgi:hypothetical protein